MVYACCYATAAWQFSLGLPCECPAIRRLSPRWCKRTNFEIGLRVPLMIRAPNHPASKGKFTADFAEALDFYRTLIGLTSPQLSADIEATVRFRRHARVQLFNMTACSPLLRAARLARTLLASAFFCCSADRSE